MSAKKIKHCKVRTCHMWSCHIALGLNHSCIIKSEIGGNKEHMKRNEQKCETNSEKETKAMYKAK